MKLLLGLLILSMNVYCADITVSNTFAPGDIIRAADVNENFTQIITAINEIRNNTNRLVLHVGMNNPADLIIGTSYFPHINQPITADKVDQDTLGGYNAGTSSYTVAEDGFYFMGGGVTCNDGVNNFNLPVAPVVNGKNYYDAQSSPSAQMPLLQLSSGDIVSFRLLAGGSMVGGPAPSANCPATNVNILLYKKGF